MNTGIKIRVASYSRVGRIYIVNAVIGSAYVRCYNTGINHDKGVLR